MKKIVGICLFLSLCTAHAGWFDRFVNGGKTAFSFAKSAITEPAVIGAALCGYLSKDEKSYFPVAGNPTTYELKRDSQLILMGALAGACVGSGVSLVAGIPKGIQAEKDKSILDFTHKERVRRTALWLCALSFVSWHDQLTIKQAALSVVAIPLLDKLGCWAISRIA